jgi:hypothetical protein
MTDPAFITRKDQVKKLDKAGLRKFLAFARIRRHVEPCFDRSLISLAEKRRRKIFTDERLAVVKRTRDVRKTESVEERILRLFYLQLDAEEVREGLRTMELLIKQTEADIEPLERLGS